MTWADERARFPVFDRLAYLNAGTFGPVARATADAMAEVARWELERGRGGRAYFDEMIERRERVRASIAREIGVPVEHVALTESTTQSVHVVVTGLGLRPTDEVVTTDIEHFGLVGPLIASGVRVRVARLRELRAADSAAAIAAAVTPRTRLLALSHVAWVDGRVLPWRDLRESAGVPVLVDGAQSVGAIGVDARDADFYTVSAQKWLCGPASTGALAVREPEALPPRLVGVASQRSYSIADATFEPRPGAPRFDSMFTPASSLAGLEVALSDLPAGRFERARELTEQYREALLGSGYDVVSEPGQGTLVSWRVDGGAAAVVAELYGRGVVVRDLPGTGLVRASVGWWNDDDDLERLLAALQETT
jgi:L-cysteine/cystine lyase